MRKRISRIFIRINTNILMTILSVSFMRFQLISDDKKRLSHLDKLDKRIARTTRSLGKHPKDNSIELDKLKVLSEMMPSIAPKKDTREGHYVDIANIHQSASKFTDIEPDGFTGSAAKGLDLFTSLYGLALSEKSPKFASEHYQGEIKKFTDATEGVGQIMKRIVRFIQEVILVELLPQLRRVPIHDDLAKGSIEHLAKKWEETQKLEERYYRRKARKFFRTHKLLNFRMMMNYKSCIGLSRIAIAHRSVDTIEDGGERAEAIKLICSALLGSLQAIESADSVSTEVGDEKFVEFAGRIESRLELLEDFIEIFDQRLFSILRLEDANDLIETRSATLKDPTNILKCSLLRFFVLELLREHKYAYHTLCKALANAVDAISKPADGRPKSQTEHVAVMKSALTELVAASIRAKDGPSSFFFISELLSLGFRAKGMSTGDAGESSPLSSKATELELELLSYSRNQIFDNLVGEVTSQGVEAVKGMLDKNEADVEQLTKVGIDVDRFKNHSLDVIRLAGPPPDRRRRSSATVFWQMSRHQISVSIFKNEYGPNSSELRYVNGITFFSPAGVSRLRADCIRAEIGFNISLEKFRGSLRDTQYRGAEVAISDFEACLHREFAEGAVNFVSNVLQEVMIEERSVIKFINGADVDHHFPKYSASSVGGNAHNKSTLFENWNIVEGTRLVAPVLSEPTEKRGVVIVAAELSHQAFFAVEEFCHVHDCSLLVGADATISKVLAEMSDCQFAAIIAHATSGSGRTATPKISFFDGALDVAELANGQFKSSLSILLACCESGLSSPSSDFSVLSSLPKLLLDRGAGTVVSTNWPVYTNLVSGLLKRLVGTDIYDHAGLRDAVRQYQLDLKSGETDISDFEVSDLFALHMGDDQKDLTEYTGQAGECDLILDGGSKLNWAAFSTYQN